MCRVYTMCTQFICINVCVCVLVLARCIRACYLVANACDWHAVSRAALLHGHIHRWRGVAGVDVARISVWYFHHPHCRKILPHLLCIPLWHPTQLPPPLLLLLLPPPPPHRNITNTVRSVRDHLFSPWFARTTYASRCGRQAKELGLRLFYLCVRMDFARSIQAHTHYCRCHHVDVRSGRVGRVCVCLW